MEAAFAAWRSPRSLRPPDCALCTSCSVPTGQRLAILIRTPNQPIRNLQKN